MATTVTDKECVEYARKCVRLACLPANQAVKDHWWRRGNCRARLRVRSASTPIASRIGIPINMFDAMGVVLRKAP